MRQVSEKKSSQGVRTGRCSCRTWFPAEIIVRVTDDGGESLRAARRFVIERYLEAGGRRVLEDGGRPCLP